MTQLKSAAPGPVDRLAALVAGDMSRVNRLILDHMQSPVALIPQLAGHLIAAGGKRLRPMLTLAAARLCDYQGARHLGLAACVEFIHTATLLHDDVVDESDRRRGQDSANAVWGNQASVLVGDFLFSRAFQLMTEDGSLEVLRVLSGASATIAEGEVLQLMATGDMATGADTYMKVIESKTAALFAAACEVGAIVADAPGAARQALRLYGHHLGIAFQIADDVLDYRGGLGKSVGDDFREGKMTLPVLLALENARGEERDFWRRVLVEGEQTDGDFATALGLIEGHGALDAALAVAEESMAQAVGQLAQLPAGPVAEALADVARHCVARAG